MTETICGHTPHYAKGKCKKCYDKAYDPEYYKKNKGRISAHCKKYYEKNRDRLRERHRQNYQKNKDKISFTEREKRTGWTKERFLETLNSQDGRCKICSTQMVTGKKSKASMCADHCHKSGKQRGILCKKCNAGLGQFDDSVELLQLAMEYLRAWS